MFEVWIEPVNSPYRERAREGGRRHHPRSSYYRLEEAVESLAEFAGLSGIGAVDATVSGENFGDVIWHAWVAEDGVAITSATRIA